MRKARFPSLDDVPLPSHMPGDRDSWFRQLDLSNFINAFYQYRDLQKIGECKNVLMVGPGQGLGTQVLKWRGYDVKTLDIDGKFHPDFVGSVHDMHMFARLEFDAVIVSHVLEHLAVPFLDRSLSEISRVGRYALIYLPVAGRHFHIRFKPDLTNFQFDLVLDFYNYLGAPDGVTARYMEKQHFWEVGRRGYKVKDLLRRFKSHFEIVHHYRNYDWLPSRNFILKSKSWKTAST
jgi:hypothetical protein